MPHLKLCLPNMSLSLIIHIADYQAPTSNDFILIRVPLEQFSKHNRPLYHLASINPSEDCEHTRYSRSFAKEIVSNSLIFYYENLHTIAQAIPIILSDEIFPHLLHEQGMPFIDKNMMLLKQGLSTYNQRVYAMEQQAIFAELVKKLIDLIINAPFDLYYTGTKLGSKAQNKHVTVRTSDIFFRLLELQDKPLMQRADILCLFSHIEEKLSSPKSCSELAFFHIKKRAFAVEQALFHQMLDLISQTSSLEEIAEEIELRTFIPKTITQLISSYIR